MTINYQKITELDAADVATGDDLLILVNEPGGTPVTKSITVAKLFGNLTEAVFIYNNAGIEFESGALDSIWANLHLKALPADSMNARFFVGCFEMFVGTQCSAVVADSNDKLALFAGTYRDSDRTESVWAGNMYVQVRTGAGVYSAICLEVDVSNEDADCTQATAVSLDGIHINCGGDVLEHDVFRGLLINSYSDSQWVYGIQIPYAAVKFTACLLGDAAGADPKGLAVDQWGDGNYGINVRRFTDTTPAGVMLSCTNAALDAFIFYVSAAVPAAGTTPIFTTVGTEVVQQLKVGVNGTGPGGVGRAVYVDNA